MSFSVLRKSEKLSTRLVVHLPSQKGVCDENKLPKRGPYQPLILVLRWPGGPWGVGGFNNYLQVCETGYLTRPWAVGPANLSFRLD